MKQTLILLLLLWHMEAISSSKYTSVEALASQLESGLEQPLYDIKTQEGLNMDCLKIIKKSEQQLIGVFHSSKEQQSINYNALYLSSKTTVWTKIVQLSQRGSQGYLYQLPSLNSLLLLYELQNHEHGNTVAIRYYQSYSKLENNNFLYEYQLLQKIDTRTVRNIGTPSVEDITLVKAEQNPHFNVYNLTIKFHYSPDGTRDLPGLGNINMFPLRDFVDSRGQWIGGCKEKYSDWSGSTDSKVQQAIARVVRYSKIGQRDLFLLNQDGATNRYYLYEVNINPNFNWKDWRIVLYSEKDNRAVQVHFSFGGDQDVANPHISMLDHSVQTNSYLFILSFFLPSEGVPPGTEVRAGEMTALLRLSP